MIEVEVAVSKVIKWGNCIAHFENGRFSGVDLNATIEDITANPEGFYAFAGAIVDELEAHKPEPEKKPRKPRCDRGVKKNPPAKTDTAANPPVSEVPGVITVTPITPMYSAEATEDVLPYQITPLKDKLPHLDIHGPNGTGIFRASFKDKMESGFVLPNVVSNLKKSFGGKWPDDMSAEDKKMGNDLIAGKKPE